jgi:predicted TIM-barrel fold metal-dependent hydrolase
MKIIDFHTHYLPEHASVQDILSSMDKNNIESSVMLACPDHARYHDCGLTGTNEEVEKLVNGNPDRFIGGVYVEPRNVMEAQTRVREYHAKGFKVIKMWPAHGFSPDDPMIYPVWEVINELKMIVLFHSGVLGNGHNRNLPLEIIRSAAFNSKYGQPILLDQVARFFPDIKFIIAHGAYPWTLEALEMSFVFKNIYIDLSCPLGFEAYNQMKILKPGRIAWDRLLFGSDTAGITDDYVTRWDELMNDEFFIDHKEDFFYNNAKKLLD